MQLMHPETSKLPGGPKEHGQEKPVQPARSSVVFKHVLRSGEANLLAVDSYIIAKMHNQDKIASKREATFSTGVYTLLKKITPTKVISTRADLLKLFLISSRKISFAHALIRTTSMTISI